MSILGNTNNPEEDSMSEEDMMDSEDEDETIARIQRAHFAQAAAMNPRRRPAAKPRRMSQKRKIEAVRNFHDFTKKLKKDTGIKIRSLGGDDLLEFSDFSSEENNTDSDGLSEEEFTVDPSAVKELSEENESYIDPETGDFVEAKLKGADSKSSVTLEPTSSEQQLEPKTLSISDIIDESGLDLSKNVEITEVEESDLCPEKTSEELLDIKEDSSSSQNFDITEKLKDMGEISVNPVNKTEDEDDSNKAEDEEDEKKLNSSALNVRRNIREVMDEKNLDASTLTAQRQESERLARVQEQQRIIREVQRQIAINRQNKIHQKTISLLQGSSLLKKGAAQKLNLPNTVLVKLPSGEIVKKTTTKQGQLEVTKVPKPTTSASALTQKLKLEQKGEKKEVVEIVDSSTGEESSSSSSDSDDCIMLSDSEVPPSPEAEEDPGNSGLHVNDAYNMPDEQGRVQINIGHPENEEDIFLAPQIARIIKPHQIGGVRFLFDNIIESTERFSNSTGFGCILAHSMGLGKTLQIVCFCDIFLRHTSSKTVLCIMPINTLQNWVAEFNMWLPVDAATSPLAAHGEVRSRNFPIYVLNDSHKTLQMRAKVVKDWTTSGGVLMIGYELYRLLSMKKDKKPRKKKKADAKLEAEKEKEDKKNDMGNDDTTQGSDGTTMTKTSDDRTEDGGEIKLELDKEDKREDTSTDEDKKLLDEMYEALVKPGPDLVICDEGHRIKNSHSNISYALKQMRTKRRIVLTGYPLQNNLLEYWCMVDFVRPNYLGSKTEFCNMFERPIQNGQCIDSTPQDIRLMRYRAHVLHSLLVGFVQRRSHAVLQSTLPQKEEYVLLVRLTPLQRKLYDRFMNEVVRSASVPNPLKAFAICCKIWNHPDVLYNFLKKRSEVSAPIEEDLDLEEIGGVTKSGKAKNSKAQPRRPGKPRGSSKKPAATIPPNTTAPIPPKQEAFNSTQYPNAPYGPGYRNDRPGNYPYPYQNSAPSFYPPGQGYNNQEYGNNYYPQQPYDNNYSNQYPPNPEQGYNQNYWGNNYYGNSGYYNNAQYPEGQAPPNFNAANQPGFENSQQYQANYNPANNRMYPGAPNNQYPSGPNNNTYTSTPPGSSYPPSNPPNNAPFPPVPDNVPNNPPYPNPTPSSSFPTNSTHNNPPFPGNAPPPNNTYPPTNPPFPPNNQENYPNPPRPLPYQDQYPNPPYGQYESNSGPPPYPNSQGPQNYNYPPQQYPGNAYPANPPAPYQYDNQANYPQNYPPRQENQPAIKIENNGDPTFSANVKTEPNIAPQTAPPFGPYNYNQSNSYESQGDYSQFPNYSQPLETKPPLCSASSSSPVTSWPIPETMKSELDRIKNEDKIEMKSESDGEVKIEDLDTKTIVKDEVKKEKPAINELPKIELNKSDTKNASDSESETPKKGRGRGRGKEKKEKSPRQSKAKAKPKGRKDRKTSKEKNDDSESEQSEKEEKLNKEEEMALVKKAEEMTYDWATDLLKDYTAGIIENSSKMELFFYILNESIKMGDRLLLFSQSLFTLNLIEDFLERNYIPGTNRVWERNTSYFRLDGSTHALEREKLINEFNANPHVYLFLVSTRAGSLGINLVGANRVIVFDASWNPCHDTQAVCRVYRYGQKKPCFVYRFVMDCCLEKKIYDRQINKQGMADRVVDECNPDAVLSMKEITNLCFDNDEKETEPKDLQEFKDKYLDVLMQGILTLHSKLLTKEPFQHESLLVDRKEKKLSSAEKRLAQRGYELEKKAALAPKPTTSYRTVRTADGSLVQRPVASVRPMQHGARWIPADVWRRQGMTAQEMTLPLDVVIPTNSSEKTNIVLKAGQRVMVLKSPKGIYMQLESGKIIAIKTALKGLGPKGETKETPLGKKIMSSRPSPINIPGSLKNNSAITITSKSGPRFQRLQTRPSLMGPKMSRSLLPGQKIAEIRNRLGEMRSYGPRPKLPTPQMRMLRPGLPGTLSITKIPKKSDERPRSFEEETQILDSDDDEGRSEPSPASDKADDVKCDKKEESKNQDVREEDKDKTPIVLTTTEQLPPEDVLETNKNEPEKPGQDNPINLVGRKESKINLLKNYRHKSISRPQTESSLSRLERTAIALNSDGVPDFRRNLDDITQSYSPDEKSGRKKKSPQKIESQAMSHSVSSLLGNSKPRPEYSSGKPQSMPLNMTHSGLMTGGSTTSNESSDLQPSNSVSPSEPYPSGSGPPEGFGQYPGYGMGYGAYPNPAYYGGYGGYYPPYAPPAPFPPPNTTTDPYLPPNPQW
ncbi:helicase ARIP4 [Pieris brassicae]|uniref:helicase ARIP4 n=1 Tax=Pieris brassicae TaxID=7116 RepID=UPI001E661653|nr:helicase ARIP4 [Pieris brassicae]